MPYSNTEELPESVRSHLPKKAQEIYMKVFNNAWEQYDCDEVVAHKVAWAAVKKSYKRLPSGKWKEI